jgi:protein-tyrosine phosphatase
LPSRPPRELIYCRFPILDGPGNDAGILSLAVHTIGTLIDRRVPALVCCSSGRSRSPALVAAALAVVRHKPATEALKEVAEHSPSDVSPGLWKEILDLLSGLGVPRA